MSTIERKRLLIIIFVQTHYSSGYVKYMFCDHRDTTTKVNSKSPSDDPEAHSSGQDYISYFCWQTTAVFEKKDLWVGFRSFLSQRGSTGWSATLLLLRSTLWPSSPDLNLDLGPGRIVRREKKATVGRGGSFRSWCEPLLSVLSNLPRLFTRTQGNKAFFGLFDEGIHFQSASLRAL